jgi:hypothetical protein
MRSSKNPMFTVACSIGKPSASTLSEIVCATAIPRPRWDSRSGRRFSLQREQRR